MQASTLVTVVTFVAAASLAVPQAFASNTIYRCNEAGATVYSDRPCSAQSQAVALSSVSAVSFTQRSESDFGALPVALGMSPKAVFQAMGRPRETVAMLQGRQLVEYWLYRGAHGATRIAFEQGRVTAVAAH
ncbi:MAG TPA: DUF4124 domain-containing protein [Casimicrobiaceae bacterium]|nr:DUF4124 domain-containing protein [Casimicrobiaceae bacterium]